MGLDDQKEPDLLDILDQPTRRQAIDNIQEGGRQPFSDDPEESLRMALKNAEQALNVPLGRHRTDMPIEQQRLILVPAGAILGALTYRIIWRK